MQNLSKLKEVASKVNIKTNNYILAIVLTMQVHVNNYLISMRMAAEAGSII